MTTTTKRARRRTFKEVASEAHAKGYSEGLAQGRKDRDDLFNTNADLGFTVLELEKKLDKINGSLITALRYWAKGHV
jgi:hypothetical protein